MDKSRILPPLVRGKVTGIFDFFIDEIVISKNVLFVTDNFDIITQVQWWGEISPVSIRPKILHIPNKLNSSIFKACYHSVQYEVKTTVDLFKSYLNACEVLELSVYEAVENYVIGSAFLKNLTYLLNRNNEIILMPIIDYLGEEIGQIKIHTYFFEYPKDKKHLGIFTNKPSADLDMVERNVTGFLKNNYVFPAEKTIFYDGYSKLDNLEVKPALDYSVIDNKSNLSVSNFESGDSLNQPKETFVNFPKICVSKDSSKVLNFDLGLKNKQKNEKIKESKLGNKFGSESIKYKSKPKSGVSTVKVPKKTALTNSSKQVKKNVNQDLKPAPVKLQNRNSNLESNLPTDTNKRVFDYLLGSSMSQENEEVALKDFKKMSPSHDIVSSINELCLRKDETKICDNLKPDLQFDLTNPIERDYYEMFFVKSNTHDFEIAELLNEHRSKSIEKDKSNDEYSCSVDNMVIDKADYLLEKGKGDCSQNACARCKYYKKLHELDAIIESLKYIEKNMLKDEVKKQGCKVSNR